MSDQRNTLLAIVLAVAILFAFQTFYVNPKAEKEKARQQALSEQTGTPGREPSAPSRGGPRADRPGAPGAAPGASPSIPTAPATPRLSGVTPEAPGHGGRERLRAERLRSTPRVRIDSPRLNGSISLTGGRVDDLTLADYRQDIDAKNGQIRLFSPPGSDFPYFVQFGWAPSDRKVKVPGPDTPWRADIKTLTPSRPVKLSWDNGEGLRFTRTYALDEYYMFTVTQRVENRSKSSLTLYPYGFISRTGTPETLGYFILHEGPLGVFNGTLKEIDYDDLRDSGKIVQSTQGGWIGITDKYWLAALVPDQKQSVETRFVHSATNDNEKDQKYQVDYRGPGLIVRPGTNAEVESHFFAGAKEVKLLDAYADYEFAGFPLGLKDPELRRLKVQRLDLAIDFGWYFFLTKPFFYALAYFHDLLGNFGLAILLLTVLVKILFFPLANKSYRAMSKMKILQPEMVKIKERFKDDKTRINQEMMELYKREKANPAAGCAPMIIQIPVFFSLYKVLFVSIEMRHAPFYGWIHDLSARDPTSIFNLFGLIPFTPPDFLLLGAWPLIMGISMFLQMRLNPQPADPIQAKIFMFMPIMFTILLAPFPAGLVIYWAWNNVLSMAQQWVIMKRSGALPSKKKKTTSPSKSKART